MNRLGLPVFEAKIDGFNEGILAISLVDIPAVESNFLVFKEDDKVFTKFTIDNEDQHLITGVVMRCDFPIYRNDESYGEYFIYYSADTIKVMAEKMMNDNTFNHINIMHNDDEFVEGVNIVELFIKDTSKGIDPIGFENIEEGSLFATYKINNPVIWEEVKSGEFKGFSLQGYFTIEPSNRFDYRKQNNNTFLNTMTRLFNRFLKSFVKCGSVETDKGTIYWVGEADLQIGDELFYNTENEEAVKVEDGEYTLNDGTVIVVKEGLVSEIREKDGEQEGELDMAKKQCMEDEEVIVEEPEVKEEVIEDEPKDDKYDELKRDIDDLRKEHEELKGMFEEMKNTLDTILNKPAAEPIVEEFKKASYKSNSGIPVFGSRSKSFK